MNRKQHFIWVSLFFTFFLIQVTLEAQEPVILDSKMKPGISNDMRIEELKVRWKKAALENCPGVPCVTTAVPGAPTAVVATAGNASASVVFVAPTNNGGSAITSYTVTSNPATSPVTGATSPINVTGLTNGTAYTFTVVATNAVGNSIASAASTAVTPAAPNTIPGAPTAVVATACNTTVSVSFVAPTNNGGSVVTGYTVTSNPSTSPVTGATSPINVTGLTNGTAYTFTVVATNVVGNSLASLASTAVTPTPTITDIDGNLYNIVNIGTQCWTKENLKVTKYNDGITAIPDETANNAGWGTLGYGARAEYPGVAGYVSTYGYLYNWQAVAGIITAGGAPDPTKNICPLGWYVPTDMDWTTLTDFLGPNPGTKLKENSTLWTINTGTDDFDFSGLPSGFRGFNGSFFDVNSITYFWSADRIGPSNDVWNRSLNLFNGLLNRVNFVSYDGIKSVGASVRCLKD